MSKLSVDIFVRNKFPEDVFFGGVVVSSVTDRAVSSA